MSFELLKKRLKKYIDVNTEKIITKEIPVKKLKFLKLRDCLINIGTILEEDLEEQIYDVQVKAGFKDKNNAILAVQLLDDKVMIAAYADEGLINQHTSEKAIKKVEESLKKFHKPKHLRKLKIVLVLIVLAFIAVTAVYSRNYSNRVAEYNDAVSKYNVLAEGYNDYLKNTSIDNIKNMADSVEPKSIIEDSMFGYLKAIPKGNNPYVIKSHTKKTLEAVDELAVDYQIISQIHNPEQTWVTERLKSIKGISDIEAVSTGNDPNMLLNKKGGYTACIYFSYDSVDASQVKGNDSIERGNDGGGTIEVYKTAKDAETRCEYLKQFNDTLLYPGSYAVVGTMVVRTSYLLSNEQQVSLTNSITEAFTELN